tara:strand:- start:470 stop:877 length:408 start_codon:yes stop_codon:yes gene_type:complete
MNIIDNLPDDILEIIFRYIKPKYKFSLNKYYYQTYNIFLSCLIFNYDSYIRDIIRNKCYFVFQYLIDRDFTNWLSNYNYTYRDKTYKDFLSFIIDFARNNKAYKCIEIINLHLSLSKLKKVWCINSKDNSRKWIH